MTLILKKNTTQLHWFNFDLLQEIYFKIHHLKNFRKFLVFFKIPFKRKLTTAPGVPRRSPIQVLTRPNVAWLQWSDENWYFQRGMAVVEGWVSILDISNVGFLCKSENVQVRKWPAAKGIRTITFPSRPWGTLWKHFTIPWRWLFHFSSHNKAKISHNKNLENVFLMSWRLQVHRLMWKCLCRVWQSNWNGIFSTTQKITRISPRNPSGITLKRLYLY